MKPQIPLSPRIIRTGEGHCLELHGEIRYQLLDGQDTGGNFALAHSKFQKGAGSPFHVHTREDEWFCIESGQFRFQIGEKLQILSAGDFVFGPRNVPHSYECHSDDGELLIGIVGAGFENFFREIASLSASGAWPEPEAMRAMATSYGVHFDAFAAIQLPQLAPKMVRAGDGECLEAFGDSARILLASSDTDSRFCLAEVQTPSLSGPPPHVHEREDEVFLIRAGRYEFQIGDARVQVQPGDLVFAPRGVAHSFRVVSGEPGQFLLFAAPGGFDVFFGQCAELFQSGAVTPQLIGEIGAAHGVRFLVPEA